MIYVVLNLAMAAFMVGLAFYTENQTKEEVDNPLVTMDYFLAAALGFMALTVWASIYHPDRMMLLFVRLSLIFTTVYAIDFCIYFILFPSYERPASVKAVRWILILFSCWFCFTKVKDINITDFLGLQINSIPLFEGRLSLYFPYTLYDLYKVIVLFVGPAFSALIMILRAENREDRLNMQKTIMNALSLSFGWLAVVIIGKATGRVPMFSTLTLFGVGLAQVLIAHSAMQNFLYDLKYVIGVAVTFTVSYLIPAVFVGFFFPRLWPIAANNLFLFILYISAVIVAAVTISYQVSKYLSKRAYFRSFQYADTFEAQLSKMDYSGEPEEIVKAMESIFSHNLGLSEITILVENEGKLRPVFDKEKQIELSASESVFDSMLNQNRTVVLKSAVENGHAYESDKEELLKLFNSTGSDAIILLAEGRHLIGAMLLGPKAGGNIYNEYDSVTFTKLYSYFFVFGYYLKNIANQSIVGTVNREIRMSSQIITSIQENMDPIKNPHYDAGYIMEHAHNIGGEFVDLIRLTEHRHIFVLGDLSGKGISASMSMVIIKSIIRTYLEETRDFKLLVEKVNQFIRFNLPKGTFFEGMFGLIDFTDDTLYYINCGVPSLFLYTRSYNNVIEIQGDGRVLGFVKDISHLIKVKKVKLNPGDIIVTCTDGLIDSKSLRGETYGKERIQKSITESTAFTADRIAKTVYQTCSNFLSKELDDDVSILVIKRLAK